MAGLLMLLVIILYCYLSKAVIAHYYQKHGTKKAKYLATAIMVLIPTWDMLPGYVTYHYLCETKPHVNIYRTVDNVEGFYYGIQDETYPQTPYEGYRFIDYKGRKSGKYYRNYWVDNNTSEKCILPKYKYDRYAEAFGKGRCVVRDEIAESEVSQWQYGGEIESTTIRSLFGIFKLVSEQVIDRKSGEVLSEIIRYSWSQGWLVSTINNHFARLRAFDSCEYRRTFDDGYINTLKPKKEEK